MSTISHNNKNRLHRHLVAYYTFVKQCDFRHFDGFIPLHHGVPAAYNSLCFDLRIRTGVYRLLVDRLYYSNSIIDTILIVSQFNTNS